MADLARTQFLRFGRGAKERVDPSLGKKLHWRYGRTQNPIEVLAGVEPNVGGHASHIQMRDQAEGLGAHFPSLQIPNVADTFVRKQFEAADMHTATIVIGSPASIAAMAVAAYIKEKSSSPRPIAADTIAGGVNWYWISAKPSARSSSSATYCGAMQMPAFFAKRMVV